MTLVITAVTPRAIIMGADSSIGLAKGAAPDQLYSGFTKVVHWPTAGLGLTVYGTFPIQVPGGGTYREWLNGWLNANGDPPKMGDILGGLCAGMDEVMKGVANPGGLHVAGWGKNADGYPPDAKMPMVFRVKQVNGKFAAEPQIFRKVAESIHRSRTVDGNTEWATMMFTDGAPSISGKTLTDLHSMFTSIVGAGVPAMNEGAMFLYVRTLITLTGDLYRLAGAPPLVSPPVDMLMLMADDANTLQFHF